MSEAAKQVEPCTLVAVRLKAAIHRVPTLVAGLVATLILIASVPAAESTVRVAGELKLAFEVSPLDRMAVDSSRHRGYYLSRSAVPTLWVLDLKHLRAVTHKPMSLPDGPEAVDTIRHKIFYPDRALPGACETSAVWILDGISLTAERRPLPCDPAAGPVQMDSIHVDSEQGVLSVLGHRGSSTVVREMTVRDEGISLSWEIVQRGLCDSAGTALIARMKHGTAAYCAAGSSGRAIWIPTWHGMPIPDAVGHAIVRITGAGIAGPATAIDGRTGRVAIAPQGGGVSVYDAPDERQVASTSPAWPSVEPAPNSSLEHAFDSLSGRLYLLRDRVLEAADVRSSPASPPSLFDVPNGLPGLRRLSVDSRLHRIFVPSSRGLLAVEDDRPALLPAASSADAKSDPSKFSNQEPAPSGLNSGAHYRDAVVPSTRGWVMPDTHPDTGNRPAAIATVDAHTRTGLDTSWLVFTTLPFLVTRFRRARTLLRAPPSFS